MSGESQDGNARPAPRAATTSSVGVHSAPASDEIDEKARDAALRSGGAMRVIERWYILLVFSMLSLFTFHAES